LVELLVVVSIIAVLVAMLLPALNRARAQAQALQCQSNLRQIGQAFFNYAIENRDYVPPVGYAASLWFDNLRGATFYHILGKSGYLGSKQIFYGSAFGFQQTRFGAARCPADTGGRYGTGFWNDDLMGGSYVMNWSITWGHYYLGYEGPAFAYKCYRKNFLKGTKATVPGYRTQKLPAHQARFVVDTSDRGGWVLPYYYHGLDDFVPTQDYAYEGRYIYSFRHPNQTVNALYMDGHVQAHQHYLKTGVALWQWLYPDDL
jgi:prepilin-type processing-associated H-X9-DG protein